MRFKVVFTVLISLLLLFSGVGIASNQVEVTFTYSPPDQVNSVYLAGNFNGWSTGATPMLDEDGDGVYEVTIKLKPGKYSYKYVVNGEEWRRPPRAESYESDGYGGQNGVIYVEDKQQEAQPSSAGDKAIEIKALAHDKENIKYANPLADNRIRIKFKTKKDDVQKVILHYDDGEKKSTSMKKFLTDKDFDYYRAVIEVEQRNFGYHFEVRNESQILWYGGQNTVKEAGEVSPINYVLQKGLVFSTPEWVKDAVFYQIFPDRFYNGNPENDPERIDVYRGEDSFYRALIPDWKSGIPPGSSEVILTRRAFTKRNNMVKGDYGYHVFYGGDLQGVEDKIPYLKELGINAVYFNSLFEAASNHKYNTSGYKVVEDNFAVKGDREASEKYLRRLIEKLHQNGIKVIFDINFNYTGYEHWAFQNIVEHGEDSDYADWYFIKDYPVRKLYNQGPNNPPNYKAWWGFGSYPILNVNNPEVKEYLFEATEKWLDPNGDGDPSDGIDGWRVDMPEAVKRTNSDFWRKWRKFVKDINPRAYITGGVWDNANKYLQGDELDAVVNHRFRKAVVDFIAKGEITAEEFADRLIKIRFQYPEQSKYILQNLIGNHDTKRFLTAAGGNKDKLKLAAFLQMTYVGSPMIYYGDEVGMEGEAPPDSRRTMLWEHRGYTRPDEDLLNHYKKLIELRKESAALRRGEIEEVPVEDEMVYAFKRSYQGEELLVLINAGKDRAKISIPVDLSRGRYKELYSGRRVRVRDGTLQMEVKPLSGAIVRLKDGNRGRAELIVTAERNAGLVVRGSMNNWGAWQSGEDIVMEEKDNGTWGVTLEGLTPGKSYAYKYVLKYKNTDIDIGSVGPEGGGDFSFTAQGSTHTLTTPFTKEELDEERGWFTVKEGTVKAGNKKAKLGEKIEVGVPTEITVNNKYHSSRTVSPRLDIGEVNRVKVKLNQPEKPIKHTFTFDPDEFGNPKIVEGIWVKGSFDSWKEHKLVKRGDVYQTTLRIYPGKYKYVYFDKAHQNNQSNYNYYKDDGSEFTLKVTTE